MHGHQQRVYSVEFSRDGKYIVSGSGDHNLKVWNFEEKREEFTLRGHTGAVSSVSFSRDGKYIVSGSWDNIKVWSVLEKQEEFTLIGHENKVTSVRFSNQTNLIVSGSEDNNIKVWSFLNRKLEFTLTGHTNGVFSVGFSEDDRFIVSGSKDNNVIVWNTLEKRQEYTFIGHENCVYSARFSREGHYIVSGSSDKNIKVWNFIEKREEFTFRGHTNSVYSVEFSADSKFIVSGSEDKNIIVWNVKDKHIGLSLSETITNSNSKAELLENKYIRSEPSPKFSQIINDLLEFQISKNSQISVDNNFFSSLALITPQFKRDPYFQSLFPFKYALNCIYEKKLSSIPLSSLDFYFSTGMYRPTHVAGFNGDKLALKNWLQVDSQLILRADAYGKSPLFYTISNKHQDCTQIIMEYIISLKSPQNVILENSLHSVRNDFTLIIKNSSNLLPDFINKILLTSEYKTIPETANFPQTILQPLCYPILEKFELLENSREMPAIIKFSAFAVDSGQYSYENINFLESIRDCTNDKIFECFFIKEYIDYNWNGAISWVIFLSTLQFLTIIAFIANLIVGSSNIYLLLVFTFMCLMIFVWEVLQIASMGFISYFSDIWNWVDTLTPILVIYWILALNFDFKTEYETYLLAVMLMIRGLTAFKASSGTRYYVRLILVSMNSIKYFLVLFCYSTLFFSVVIAIAQNATFNFDTLWNQSWDINFGGDISMDQGNPVLVYITLVFARIVNVILMLNMLISILGDSYDNFLIERHIIDYREKLDSIIEIQKMMFFKRTCGSKKFFNFLVTPYEDINDAGDWQGKILYMEKRQERKMQGLSNKIAEFEYKNNEKLSGVENKIVSKVESKINEVESKITTQVVQKILDVENKILGLENKIDSFETKLTEMDGDLKKIIQLLLKDD